MSEASVRYLCVEISSERNLYRGSCFFVSGRIAYDNMTFTRFANCEPEGRSKLEDKLMLYGFNNLTKTLSFNIYDICYAKTSREQQDYIAYIDEQYNSERLTAI